MKKNKFRSESGQISSFVSTGIAVSCFVALTIIGQRLDNDLHKSRQDLASARARITELEKKLDEGKKQVQKFEDENWKLKVQLSFCQSGKDF